MNYSFVQQSRGRQQLNTRRLLAFMYAACVALACTTALVSYKVPRVLSAVTGLVIGAAVFVGAMIRFAPGNGMAGGVCGLLVALAIVLGAAAVMMSVRLLLGSVVEFPALHFPVTFSICFVSACAAFGALVQRNPRRLPQMV
jgi:hypothetical protein